LEELAGKQEQVRLSLGLKGPIFGRKLSLVAGDQELARSDSNTGRKKEPGAIQPDIPQAAHPEVCRAALGCHSCPVEIRASEAGADFTDVHE
jgi:hypothetical protein